MEMQKIIDHLDNFTGISSDMVVERAMEAYAAALEEEIEALVRERDLIRQDCVGKWENFKDYVHGGEPYDLAKAREKSQQHLSAFERAICKNEEVQEARDYLKKVQDILS